MDKKLKIGLIIAGALLTILVISTLITGLASGWESCESEMEEYGMMVPWMMGGFGIGWLAPVVWIVIVGLIIWIVIALARGAGKSSQTGLGKQPSALEILQQRYARGEIGKEEFEQKRKDLS